MSRKEGLCCCKHSPAFAVRVAREMRSSLATLVLRSSAFAALAVAVMILMGR